MSGFLAAKAISAQRLAPGVLMCATIAAAASFLSEHYGGPAMLFALLLGIAFHFLSQEGPCVEGIEFTARRLLRIGVALLGVRVTVQQIEQLGIGPLALVVLSVVLTIAAGWLLARLFGRSTSFGLLAGGAVAICGASAALAIAAVLPRDRISERDTLFTVVAVTALSTIAMIIYPILYGALDFGDRQIGILLGTTIHDVAQVVGAGYAVSEEAGDVATYVKLLRVAMLPVVVLVLAFAFRGAKAEAASGTAFPWFAVAFAAILIANSAGLIPPLVREVMEFAARALLIAAIAALGIKTSLKAMFDLGFQHAGVVIATTVFLFALATGLSFILV